ncbi:MAG: family 1 glycosylhydrolase, partial [Cellulomonadaceae bacterium]|nr:family 1 glycosylhydrolase [Cellulomonadaceae bacterium]
SIWDTYAHYSGRVDGGDSGDVADDHYHRWEEDVDHLVRLGVKAYRLSISWSRVMPGGRGPVNPAGVAFYRGLLEALRARGISPYVTLYHWDLPQELEDEGGWPVRSTAEAFADYARAMASELGDLVDLWITLNEPWCSAYLGYASGVHAPGRSEPAAALAAVHHLNLAHGLAVAALRDVLPAAKVSVVLNLHILRAANPELPGDREAVRRIDALGNRAFLNPLMDGYYPSDLLADTAAVTDWAFVQPGDCDIIRQPLDVLGVNYYSTTTVRAGNDAAVPDALGVESTAADGHRPSDHSAWVGAEDVKFVAPTGPLTAMGWNIEPAGLTEMLVDLAQRYPGQPLMVTENGAAFDDQVTTDDQGLPRVHDPRRVAYLHDHISAVGDALAAGVDVRGYLAWSLLDNFEWGWGYSKRFGIIRVDYTTLNRIWKDSAHWYRTLATTNTLPPVHPIDTARFS